jgi:hypothetical protein
MGTSELASSACSQRPVCEAKGGVDPGGKRLIISASVLLLVLLGVPVWMRLTW